MISEMRTNLLHRLAELSGEAPNFRFGQLIINLATTARGPEVESTWDAEDEELLAAAEEWLVQYRERNESEAPPNGHAGSHDKSRTAVNPD